MPQGKFTVSFITRNREKFLEARDILAPYGVSVRMSPKAKLEIQNSDISKIASAALAHVAVSEPTMVEDSGLFITRLNGFPGPYSEYVFRTLGVRGLLDLMSNQADRRAQFRCCVAFTAPGLATSIVQGVTSGVISSIPLGKRGFGFDPIFVPTGHESTLAQMPRGQKNLVSHRSKALGKLGHWLETNRSTLWKGLSEHDLTRSEPEET